MIPGEMFIKDGEIELNAGRKTVTLTVANSGDRPIQVGSHYHFFETNPALKFDPEPTRGGNSAAGKPAACGSISPPAPRSGSNPARPATCNWWRSRASA